MSDIVPVTLITALFCEAALIAVLVWSISVADRRLWPPRQVSWLSQIIVWTPTIAVFGGAIIVSLIQWNALGWPLWLRWTIGLSRSDLVHGPVVSLDTMSQHVSRI